MSVSWSYSSYSTAVQCLRKYKYVYVDKLVPEGPESSDLVFGSALHSAINAVLTGQAGAAMFEIYWNSYKEKDVQYGRFRWEDLARLGSEFIRKFIKGHSSRYVLEFAEQRLFAEYRGIRIEGTPDFYGQYDGRSALRDFKTAGRNYEAGRADTALQLYLYAYLCKSNFGNYPETLGYTIFNKAAGGSIQDLTWNFKEEDMIKALDNLYYYSLVWGVDSNIPMFPGNYNSCMDYSRKCQFWDKCHGGKNE